MGDSPPKVFRALTGNPFVDWGLSIAAAMAGLESAALLTDQHLKNVVGDGRALARRHQRLKAFIPVFGSNTPLHNPKPKGQSPGETHVKNYASLLVRIRDAIGHETNSVPCEVCGAPRTLGVVHLRDSAGRTPSFGRDWLPLAGAATEANLWPAATRSPHICARCLLAVRLLPSALLLVDGRLTVLQSAPPDFADIFVRELYDHVRVREQAGERETVGSKEGKRALARRLLSVLNRLRLQQRLGVVDSTTRVFAWYFTNAGDSADVTIEEIPNRALLFLRDGVDSGLGPEIERLMSAEPRKDTEWTPGMLRCLELRRDYEPLYPRGKHAGASIELFELFQARVLGRTTCALEVAHAIATELTRAVHRQEDLDSLRKPEAFRRSELCARVRRAMVQMAAEGRFSIGDYHSLFPTREGPGIAVAPDGWKVLRYYVHQTAGQRRERSDQASALPDSDAVSFIADRVLDRLLGRGETFVRNVVARAELTDDRWLRDQFLACAWREGGFTYAAWSALALDGRGHLATREWLFQTRLHLAARLSEDPHRRVLRQPLREPAATPMAGSNLPGFVAIALEEYLDEYLTVRGPGRLERDIVRQWLARRLGTHWLGERLSSPRRRAPISVHAWRNWLEDPDAAWRTFQLGLAVCNAARRLIALWSTPVEEPA